MLLRGTAPFAVAALLGGCFAPNETPDAETEGEEESGGSEAGEAAGPGTSDGTTTTMGSSGSGDAVTTEAETSAGPTGDPSADPSGDPPESCEGIGACEAAAPDGWNGPVVMMEGSSVVEPECEGDYDVLDITAFDGLEFLPAECECECGDASGASCDAEVELHQEPYLSLLPKLPATCQGAAFGSDITTLTGGEQPLTPSDGNDGWSWVVTANEVSGGACLATETVSASEPQFANRISGCGLSSAPQADCEPGQACVPATNEPLCIWSGGSVDCPAGPYQERREIYDDWSDTRDCGACTCGAPDGACDDPTVEIGGPGFGGQTVFVDISQTCTLVRHEDQPLIVDDFHTGRMSPGDVAEASCTPSAPNPSGDVQPSSPVTLCCQF